MKLGPIPTVRAVALLLSCISLAVPAAAEETQVITSGFDCAPRNVTVNKISDTHFELRFPNGGRDKKGWFMFRVVNAKYKTLRIDLKNVPGKWMTLNPVVANIGEDGLGDLKNFKSILSRRPRDPVKATNGPLIPDDAGEVWRFIKTVDANEAAGVLTLKYQFSADHAWVAMRPPYTPKLNEAFCESLKKQRGVKVHELDPVYELSGGDKFQVEMEREVVDPKEWEWQGLAERFKKPANEDDIPKLFVIQIGGMARGQAQRLPGIIIYAREHSDEHDTSWVAEGAIRFLLSNSREAQIARSRAVYYIIPLIYPNEAKESVYRTKHTHRYFGTLWKTPVTVAYANFFQNIANNRGRLDLCFNLHNVESKETTHLTCAYMEPEPKPGYSYRFPACDNFHVKLMNRMKQAGMKVARNPWEKRLTGRRLGSFLRRQFQTLSMLYEANSQAAERHLTLYELRTVGRQFAMASIEYLYSQQARPFMADITAFRQQRDLSAKRYLPFLSYSDVFSQESTIESLPRWELEWREEGKFPAQFRGLKNIPFPRNLKARW